MHSLWRRYTAYSKNIQHIAVAYARTCSRGKYASTLEFLVLLYVLYILYILILFGFVQNRWLLEMQPLRSVLLTEAQRLARDRCREILLEQRQKEQQEKEEAAEEERKKRERLKEARER